MTVNKREIGFSYTVGAARALDALKAERGAADLRTLVTGDCKLEGMTDIILTLSLWDEKKRAAEEPDYKPKPLTREDVALLPVADLYALFGEAMAAMERDQRRSVQAEASEKKSTPDAASF